MHSKKRCYKEALLAKDYKVVKLKSSEDHLTKKLAEAEFLAEQTYKVGWGNAIDQAKHSFADKDLNFELLNSAKFFREMLSKEAQIRIKGEVQEGPIVVEGEASENIGKNVNDDANSVPINESVDVDQAIIILEAP